jgi:hypothetical protein
MWYTFPPILALFITVIPLLLLKTWITRHLQGLGILLWGDSDMAMLLYFLVLLPGIVLHELSHWSFAKVMGVKTGKMEIWPSKKARGRIRLGSVRIGRADHVRASLIGLAPFITGCLAIYLIGDQILHVSDLIDPLLKGDIPSLQNNLPGYTYASDFWIWLYIIFSISNTMFPSESDRGAWWPVVATLGGIAALGYALGVIESIPPDITQAVLDLIGYLANAFALTVMANLVFVVVIAVLEMLVGALKGSQIEYQ